MVRLWIIAESQGRMTYWAAGWWKLHSFDAVVLAALVMLGYRIVLISG